MNSNKADQKTVAALRVVITKLARRLNSNSAHTLLTETEMFVLAFVDNRGPLSIKDLIAWEGLSPTMLSRVIRRLIEGELIAKREDRNDRRLANIQVTARGRRVHRKWRSQSAEVLNGALGRMDANDVAAIMAAVPAIEELAQQLRPQNAGAIST